MATKYMPRKLYTNRVKRRLPKTRSYADHGMRQEMARVALHSIFKEDIKLRLDGYPEESGNEGFNYTFLDTTQ